MDELSLNITNFTTNPSSNSKNHFIREPIISKENNLLSMKQRSTQKALETSSTISVWNWKNSKNKRSKNQRKKNVSKRISNKPLMPVADYSAEEVKFLYESKSGKTTRNSMNFDHNSMNFDHQQIQLPATAQWVILPFFQTFTFSKQKYFKQ